LKIALLAEANTVERVIVETVEAPAKMKKYRARSAMSTEEATLLAGLSDSPGKNNFEKRCEKMCEVIDAIVKNYAAYDNAKTPVGAAQQARPPVTCFKCGVV